MVKEHMCTPDCRLIIWYYGHTGQPVSTYVEESGKIYDTYLSATELIYVNCELPSLR
jgi:hypothetical protein